MKLSKEALLLKIFLLTLILLPLEAQLTGNVGPNYPSYTQNFTLSGSVVTGSGNTGLGGSDYFYGLYGQDYSITITPGSNLSIPFNNNQNYPTLETPGHTPNGEVIAISTGSVVNYGILNTLPVTATAFNRTSAVIYFGSEGANDVENYGTIGNTSTIPNEQDDVAGILIRGGVINNYRSGVIQGYNAVFTQGSGVINNYGIINGINSNDGVLSGFTINNFAGGYIAGEFAAVHSYSTLNNYGFIGTNLDYGLLADGNGSVINTYGGPVIAGFKDPGSATHTSVPIYGGEISALTQGNINLSNNSLGFVPVMMNGNHQTLNLISQTLNGVLYLPKINGPMVGGFRGNFDSPTVQNSNTLNFVFNGLTANQANSLILAIARSYNQTDYSGSWTDPNSQFLYTWQDWASVNFAGSAGGGGFFGFFATPYSYSRNQSAVMDYLSTMDADPIAGLNGSLNQLIGAMNTAGTPAQLANYFDEISPHSLQAFRRLTFDNAEFAKENIDEHLANLRDGATGLDTSGLAFLDSSLDPSLASIKSQMCNAEPFFISPPISDSAAPLFAGTTTPSTLSLETLPRWSTFLQGNVVLADLTQSSSVGNQGYTTGFGLLGTDYRLDSHWTAGALFGYSYSSVRLDQMGSTGRVSSYTPGVYASYKNKGYYTNAEILGGYDQFTENRKIEIGTLAGTNQAKPGGTQITANVTTGYDFERGALKFGPVVSAQYTRLDINHFTETGPSALSVSSQQADSLRSQIGGEVRYIATWRNMTFTPHFSLTWEHEFLDDPSSITSQLAGLGSDSFTVVTDQPKRNYIRPEVGLELQFTNQWTALLNYSAQIADIHNESQSAGAGVKYSF